MPSLLSFKGEPSSGGKVGASEKQRRNRAKVHGGKMAALKETRTARTGVVDKKNFKSVTKQGMEEQFTNHESLPSLESAYSEFVEMYPYFLETLVVDDIRSEEYGHLEESGHVCFDYSGQGLFSYLQQDMDRISSSFGLSYISANLPTHALYGSADEGTAEFDIRQRIMRFLNIHESEYRMVFTASKGSAFKLLAESYPFHLNKRLLTLYDYESEAVKWMEEVAQKKGANVMSASFRCPSLRICGTNLKKQIQEKKKKKDTAKGLFVFPVQSRVTGTKYSYQWMSQAQENGWHVLLDASALGPKDMDSLGLSLFQPDFIISAFYKVFGSDPTGFGCLFIKNTAIHCLHNSSAARGVGMVRVVPLAGLSSPSKSLEATPAEKRQICEIEEEDGDAQTLRKQWKKLHGDFGSLPSFSGPVGFIYEDENWRVTPTDLTGLKETLGEIEAKNSLNRADRHGADFSSVTGHGITIYSGFDEHGFSKNASEVVKTTAGDACEKACQIRDRCSSVQYNSSDIVYYNSSDIVYYNSSDIVYSKLVLEGGFANDASASTVAVLSNNMKRVQCRNEVEDDRWLFPEEASLQFQGDYHREHIEKESSLGADSGRGDAFLSSFTTGIEASDSHSKARKCDDLDQDKGSLGNQTIEQIDQDAEKRKCYKGLDQGGKGRKKGPCSGEVYKGSKENQVSEKEIPGENVSFGGKKVSEPDPLYSTQRECFFSEGQKASCKPWSHREHRNFTAEQICIPNQQIYMEREPYGNFHGDAQSQPQLSGFTGHKGDYSIRGGEHVSSADYFEDQGNESFIESEEDPSEHDAEESIESDKDDNQPMIRKEPEILCRGLNHADTLGLNKTNNRLRYFINWLIRSMLRLRHPGPDDAVPLLQIYGPKVKYERGASVAFNLFDWNGLLLQPILVQTLADRNNISLGIASLHHFQFSENRSERLGLSEPCRNSNVGTSGVERQNEGGAKASIQVLTAALGFITNFEDVYRLWIFMAKFLDADFVSKEVWRYRSLNQETIVVGM